MIVCVRARASYKLAEIYLTYKLVLQHSVIQLLWELLMSDSIFHFFFFAVHSSSTLLDRVQPFFISCFSAKRSINHRAKKRAIELISECGFKKKQCYPDPTVIITYIFIAALISYIPYFIRSSCYFHLTSLVVFFFFLFLCSSAT